MTHFGCDAQLLPAQAAWKFDPSRTVKQNLRHALRLLDQQAEQQKRLTLFSIESDLRNRLRDAAAKLANVGIDVARMPPRIALNEGQRRVAEELEIEWHDPGHRVRLVVSAAGGQLEARAPSVSGDEDCCCSWADYQEWRERMQSTIRRTFGRGD